MADIQHRDITAGGIHGLANWVVATDGDRPSTGLTGADLHKLCYVAAGNKYYALAAISPAVWVDLSSIGSIPGFINIMDTPFNAVPSTEDAQVDATAAIQAALNAAVIAPIRRVLVPYGYTFFVSQDLTVLNNTHIQIDGDVMRMKQPANNVTGGKIFKGLFPNGSRNITLTGQGAVGLSAEAANDQDHRLATFQPFYFVARDNVVVTNITLARLKDFGVIRCYTVDDVPDGFNLNSIGGFLPMRNIQVKHLKVSFPTTMGISGILDIDGIGSGEISFNDLTVAGNDHRHNWMGEGIYNNGQMGFDSGAIRVSSLGAFTKMGYESNFVSSGLSEFTYADEINSMSYKIGRIKVHGNTLRGKSSYSDLSLLVDCSNADVQDNDAAKISVMADDWAYSGNNKAINNSCFGDIALEFVDRSAKGISECRENIIVWCNVYGMSIHGTRFPVVTDNRIMGVGEAAKAIQAEYEGGHTVFPVIKNNYCDRAGLSHGANFAQISNLANCEQPIFIG